MWLLKRGEPNAKRKGSVPLVVQLRDKKREGRREQKERKRQGETGREREREFPFYGQA